MPDTTLKTEGSGLKSLQKMTKQIHQWLANVRAEMINFRTEMVQEIKTFQDKDVEKQRLQACLDLADNAVETIEKLYTALKTLSSAPPGMGAALVDLFFQAFSRAQAPSEKAKFDQQLEQVNTYIVRLRLNELENSLGMKEEKVSDDIEALATDLNLSSNLKRDVLELSIDILNEDSSTTTIQEHMKKIGEGLQAANPATASAKLQTLVSTLKSKLAERINSANTLSRREKDRRLQKLEMLSTRIATYEYKALTKWSASQYEEFIHNLKAWNLLLERRIRESQSHLAQIQQQAAQVTQKVSKSEIPLVRKYMQFFESVLGQQNRQGIVHIQHTIKEQIGKIIKALDQSSESDQSQTQDQQNSPSEQKPTLQNKAPIDSTGNDREALSKHPGSSKDE